MGKEVKITVNGKETEVADGTTVGALADTVVPDRTRIAIERNREIVPRGTFDETTVAPGDVIEIVTLVGGG